MRWKIKEVRFYFGYLHLSCLSDLKELVLGVGFSSSKYPTPLLQIFYLTPTLCLPGKRAGRVPTVREKSVKKEKNSRSGKSQGILSWVREIGNFGESQGKVREFYNNLSCFLMMIEVDQSTQSSRDVQSFTQNMIQNTGWIFGIWKCKNKIV